jgi:preprotein translocase subunit SecD
MKHKLKKIVKNFRVILLFLFIIFALISIFTINPDNWSSNGLSIRNVETNSSAANAGLENPSSTLSPLARERIIEIDGTEVNSVEEYYNVLALLQEDQTLRVVTNEATYTLIAQFDDENDVNLGIDVEEAPTSNIRKGLDLAGGTRVLLQPEEEVSDEDLDTIKSNLEERLNVYGLSDMTITIASDLGGNDYILVEIAGATESEVRDLLSQQGKFEAMVGNETVFYSGNNDITYVCRSAECSGIDPNRGCSQTSDGQHFCAFFFSIALTPEAANHQASITDALSIVPGEDGKDYLSEDLMLYLDDVEVDSLRIGADLKGRATTEIQISGSGSGNSQQEAITNTLQDMKKLQTIISTGSLPVSLDIVKMDTISPTLGQEFLNNLLLVALIAIAAVLVVVLVRYRNWKIVLPITLTIVSEMVLILGFAAMVSWNLDLAALAGIIIVIGTAVDHLIIITDETLKGEKIHSIKQRIKNAMFIVFGAYLTTTAGMLPLWFAGAGLLKGFAFTTIVGISFGVFVARPAYAAVIEILLKED